MKNLRLSWGALALSACVLLFGCQKDDAITPETQTLDTAFSSSDFKLDDLNALDKVNITKASETVVFGMTNTDAHTDAKHPLAEVLKKLQLNEKQMVAIKGFMHNHDVCVREHRAKIHEFHKQILAKANAAREEYVRAYKAGKISKAELEHRLNALRLKVQETLNSDEMKQMHMRIMRKCRYELFTNIESVLNSQQLRMWNHWKANLPR
jgi:hypothetical protein